jgi:serine/threonine protein kinase/Tol biopolymer transport system component
MSSKEFHLESGNLTGQLLDQYQVLEPLGMGGMATVYKAYDTRSGSIVALKVILARMAESPKSLRRFELEARVLSELHHSNIVGIMNYGKDKGLPYLVMPYISGGTLKDRMDGGPVDYVTSAAILAPIAWGLDYAHQHNVIHRDVKPSNILFTEAGRPMLTDFGIAKLEGLDRTLDLTDTGLAFGSVEYMSPEQALNRKIDYRVDVYGLGIVLYELVTGRRPFRGDAPAVVLHMQAYDPLPDPRIYAPDLPDLFAQVILKALAKNPDERFATMRVFAELLDHFGQSGSNRQSDQSPTEAVPLAPTGGFPPESPDDWMESPRSIPDEWSDSNEAPSEAALPSGAQALPYVEPAGQPYRREKQKTALVLAIVAGMLLFCLAGAAMLRGMALRGGKGEPAVFQTTPTPAPNQTGGALSQTTIAPAEEARTGETPGLPAGQINIPPVTGDLGWRQGRLAFLQREGSSNRLMLFPLSANAVPSILYEPGGAQMLLGPAWSPDGGQIGFYSAGGGMKVWVNGQVRSIGACNSPSWSPDGRRILCKASQESTFQIYDAQDGQLIDEFQTGRGGLVPAWSPDGRSIAYATLANGISRIWIVTYDGPHPASSAGTPGIRTLSSPQLLAGDAAENYAPAWSPDGIQIAYQSGDSDGASEIWVVNRDGTNPHQVTGTPAAADLNSSFWARAPAWSPDGRWLAYVTSRNGSFGPDYGEIFVVNLSTQQAYALTSTGGHVYDWRVSWTK